jgi:hypothetical protein
MGYRTIVGLNNDRCGEWEKDPNLGRKISQAMNHAMGHVQDDRADFGTGRVIECAHADQQSLIIAEHYSGQVIAGTHWYSGQTTEERDIRLLTTLAESLGYRVTKKAPAYKAGTQISTKD